MKYVFIVTILLSALLWGSSVWATNAPSPQKNPVIVIPPVNESTTGGYAAVAISTDKLVYGVARGKTSRDQAQNDAMALCRKNAVKPSDCRIGLWFRGACGAVAIKPEVKGHRDGAWGADWAATPQDAKNKALASCGYKGCKIVETFCSN